MNVLGFIGSLGTGEILVILAIVLLLFGGRKIPDLARGLGEGIRNFRSSLREDGSEENGAGDRKSSDGSGK
jgi:sec-independent protein translocase protein TatA